MAPRETTTMSKANGYSARWSLGSSLQPLSVIHSCLEDDVHERLQVIETE
ncbi:MAG: hypothetical protein Nkreftii_000490 [Candidatus Nitrospira kreftii]|uniref:Uncharacterized protein n=1 Tax=Candidatus Nitrospira kreftii TaxID=2652173 RepID=A0A7S8IY21_9BACT|nr:MAG: hypothetical protein Nkreftii_000490 [Candidatus Nitrospira kreftii]